jgi:hypothetical protein
MTDERRDTSPSTVVRQPDDIPANLRAREPWEAPRVLAFEPFESTHAGTGAGTKEGFFYGDNS